jgi:alanine dehydrogenase
VLVENNAGDEAHFTVQDYEQAGAQIVYNTEEVYMRSDLVCRISQLSEEELDYLGPGSTILGFHHLAVTPRKSVERLMELETTLIGYEVIRDAGGDLPVLIPFGEMGGAMAVQLAAYYLQNECGGRGVLMGNIPGVPPPTVLILGAGSVGRAAARQAMVSGAHVIVLDADLRKLRAVNQEFGGRVVTSMASRDRLEQYTPIADVLIGAVLIPGERAPFLVTEKMIRAMKPGSVVMDISIDQGGCIETSRPTTVADPTFVVHDVVHYCVPNMTANLARTGSRSLASAAFPYIMALAGESLEQALLDDPGLAEGVYMYRGKLTHPGVAESLSLQAKPLAELMGTGGGS